MAVNGIKLRELRYKEGIGQAELSKRVGVSQGMISQLELGCRSCRPDTLEVIAAELKCSVEELTGFPSVWIQFMRNCKRLSNAQLEALNGVVSQLVKVGSPADDEVAAAGEPSRDKPASLLDNASLTDRRVTAGVPPSDNTSQLAICTGGLEHRRCQAQRIFIKCDSLPDHNCQYKQQA